MSWMLQFFHGISFFVLNHVGISLDNKLNDLFINPRESAIGYVLGKEFSVHANFKLSAACNFFLL